MDDHGGCQRHGGAGHSAAPMRNHGWCGAAARRLGCGVGQHLALAVAARASHRRRTDVCCWKDRSFRCRRARARRCTSMSPARSLTIPDTRVRTARLMWRRRACHAPRAGERWRLLVRARSACRNTRNFAGADPARFVFPRPGASRGPGVGLEISIADSRWQTRPSTARAPASPRASTDQVADPDAAALLVALAVGLTDRLSADQWRVFNAHRARRIWSPSRGCTSRCSRSIALLRRAPDVEMAAGAALGTLRRTRAFRRDARPRRRRSVFVAGRVLGARTTHLAHARLRARWRGSRRGTRASGRTWSLALIAVLLLDPFAPLSAGFWLSFVAVGVILAASQRVRSSNSATMVARASNAVRLLVRHHAGAGATHVRGVRWVVDRGAVGQSHRHSRWSRSCSCRWC